MTNKKKMPTGFVARCNCGQYTGALDAVRTDRSDMAKMLGKWLFDGKTVEPRFDSSWQVQLGSCKCEAKVEEKCDKRCRVTSIVDIGWITCAFCNGMMQATVDNSKDPAYRCRKCNVKIVVTNQSYLSEHVRNQWKDYYSRR